MRDARDDEVVHPGGADVGIDTDGSSPEERVAGFRAFLLSDIRGYSSFAASHGDEAAAALTDRFAALAEQHVAQNQNADHEPVQHKRADSRQRRLMVRRIALPEPLFRGQRRVG